MAVAFKEAQSDDFKEYAGQIVKNASVLADTLQKWSFNLVTGGTENHLLLVDLSNKGVTGKTAAKALDSAGLVVNYNSVPFDSRKPFDPSGIRMGTSAVTSRGFKEREMIQVGEWINAVISEPENTRLIGEIAGDVASFCKEFPAPGIG
jgi:glycine hydroxymethyltransferase